MLVAPTPRVCQNRTRSFCTACTALCRIPALARLPETCRPAGPHPPHPPARSPRNTPPPRAAPPPGPLDLNLQYDAFAALADPAIGIIPNVTYRTVPCPGFGACATKAL